MEVSLTPEVKKLLLHYLQREFPLTKRPFLAIARRGGLKEVDLLNLLQEWTKDGKMRQISAIFNPQSWGHRSSLFALKVKDGTLSTAIERINHHPGVSHNYLRGHEYNLWFTLVVPPGKDLLREAQNLCQGLSEEGPLYLPILKNFKISAVFEVNPEETNHPPSEDNPEPVTLNEKDIQMVKVLQEPLPLIKAPFLEKAKELNCEEEEIFKWLRLMKKKGALRRFGALFKHQKLGYAYNVMVVWEVEEERIDEIGMALAKKGEITHCYLRKSYPDWKYNLYTMCHFMDLNYEERIKQWAKTLNLKQYLLLPTLKELKKVRLKLFYS